MANESSGIGDGNSSIFSSKRVRLGRRLMFAVLITWGIVVAIAIPAAYVNGRIGQGALGGAILCACAITAGLISKRRNDERQLAQQYAHALIDRWLEILQLLPSMRRSGSRQELQSLNSEMTRIERELGPRITSWLCESVSARKVETNER